MSASIFDLKSNPPNEAMLEHELGPAMDWLNQIRNYIESHYGNLSVEWKFYGQKSGWVLKVYQKKRNILFVVPLHETFKVAFTFGDKAIQLIMDGDLPNHIKQELTNAPKHVEGTTIQLHITSKEQTVQLFELIRIKLNS